MSIKKKIILIFCLILLTLSFFYIFNKVKKKFLSFKNKIDRIEKKEKEINRLGYKVKRLELENGKIYSGKKVLKFKKISIGKFCKKKPLGYLDIYKNYLLFMCANGKLLAIEDYTSDQPKINLIETNFDQFNLIKKNKGSFFNKPIRDILVDKEFIYVVYYNKYFNSKDDLMQNTHIIRGKINFDKIEFLKFFSPKEFTPSSTGVSHAGGRLVRYKESFLLVVPDYMNTTQKELIGKIQDPKSIFGKVLKIEEDGSYQVFTVGHRNPQGLYYYSNRDLIFESEHGPAGGDEINLIKKGKNYGWPIVSEGREDGVVEKNDHKKNGFEEPLYYWKFNPGASALTVIDEKFLYSWSDNLLMASLTGSFIEDSFFPGYSIFRFKITKKDKLELKEKIFIGDRMRDIIYDNQNSTIIVALENQMAIGIISNKN